MSDPNEHYEDDFDDCPNCGGEGIIYSCFEEWACVDPEGGCDLCKRRCDWCNPKKRAQTSALEERAKCKLCGLEDGACICAHIPQTIG